MQDPTSVKPESQAVTDTPPQADPACEPWSRSEARQRLRDAHDDPKKIAQWNQYRRDHPDWLPDLSDDADPADFCGLNLYCPAQDDQDQSGIDLSRASLGGAKLCGSRLPYAKLCGADLSNADLTEADISGADLKNAFLIGAHLIKAKGSCAVFDLAYMTGADLSNADLSEASFAHTELWGANLTESVLWGTDFRYAKLTSANLAGAKLRSAHLRNASLEGADLTGASLEFAIIKNADLSFANLSEARVGGIRYDRRFMKGKCRGIRLSTCIGNALFRRDAEDQDFIDTFESKILEEVQQAKRRPALGRMRWRMFLRGKRGRLYTWVKAKRLYRYVGSRAMPLTFRAWGWIDYGRSVTRVAAIAVGLAFIYGLIYLLSDPGSRGTGMLAYPEHEALSWWFTPFYYSIVTYTTLGYGDVTPQTKIGQLLVTSEIVLGYISLGMLLSVLANKVARRA